MNGTLLALAAAGATVLARFVLPFVPLMVEVFSSVPPVSPAKWHITWLAGNVLVFVTIGLAVVAVVFAVRSLAGPVARPAAGAPAAGATPAVRLALVVALFMSIAAAVSTLPWIIGWILPD